MKFIFFSFVFFSFAVFFAGELPSFFAEPVINFKKSDEVQYNQLIHVNIEDRMAIDFLEARFGVPGDSFSILPRGFYDTMPLLNNPIRIRPFIHGIADRNYWQFISSAGFDYYFANRQGNFIPGSSGRILDKYSTLIFTQTGNMVLLNAFALYWELKEYNLYSDSSWQSASMDVNRVYAKLKLWKISALAGKDNLHLGPGEYGMLLSSNAAPYWMIKFQNEETIRFWGDWNFVFMKGWIKDEREDVSDPEVMAMRLTYRPQGLFDFFELGMTRSLMYSGKDRYHYKIIEYPRLLSGYEDNVPRSKWDADSYAGIDFTFHIPLFKLVPEIKVFKFYFEESGTDIKAIWQVEDWGNVTIPYVFFKFFERAYITGIFMAMDNDILRLEYTKTAYSFYKHHQYPEEGFTNNGLSMGHPLGTNHEALRFNHRHWFGNSFSFKWELGFYQLNGEKKKDHAKKFTALFPMFSLDDGLVRRGYFSFWTDWIVYGHILRCYFSVDAGPKSDSDPSPTKVINTNKATANITLGFSFLIKF